MLAIHTVVDEEHFNACFAVIGLRISQIGMMDNWKHREL